MIHALADILVWYQIQMTPPVLPTFIAIMVSHSQRTVRQPSFSTHYTIIVIGPIMLTVREVNILQHLQIYLLLLLRQCLNLRQLNQQTDLQLLDRQQWNPQQQYLLLLLQQQLNPRQQDLQDLVEKSLSVTFQIGHIGEAVTENLMSPT